MTLLDRTRLAAVFESGSTAMGHHWRLVDPLADDAEIGSTKRRYKNVLMKAVTLTGMDGGNDIHADVREGEQTIATVHSRWRTGPDRFTVELVDAHGTTIGSSDHDKAAKRLRLLDAHGTELGALDHSGDDPWPVTDATGARVAVLSRVALRRTAYSLVDDVLFDHGQNERARDFEATMHTGIRKTRRYEVAIDAERPLAQPLRTLLVLLPVLAGHSYG